MSGIPFVGPSYNLRRRQASVQRTINLVPVPIEPGNERARWVFKDVPGLLPFPAQALYIAEDGDFYVNETGDFYAATEA